MLIIHHTTLPQHVLELYPQAVVNTVPGTDFVLVEGTPILSSSDPDSWRKTPQVQQSGNNTLGFVFYIKENPPKQILFDGS